MTASGKYDHLRPGALALLDEGNSLESVARVLAVPLAVLRRWRESPEAHGQPGETQATDSEPARFAPGQPIRFRTTLTFGPPTTARVLSVGTAVLVVLVVVPTLCTLATSHFEDGLFFKVGLLLFVAVIFGCGVASLLLKAQTSLILGPDAAIAPRLFGRHVLPYSELADYWLVMHVMRGGEDGDEEIEGRRLSLHSRQAGVRPIEVFIADGTFLDPQVIERLDAVKEANRGVQPLTRIRDIPLA